MKKSRSLVQIGPGTVGALLAAAMATAGLAQPVTAPEVRPPTVEDPKRPTPEPVQPVIVDEGPFFAVSRFVFSYPEGRDQLDLPPLEVLNDVEVSLGRGAEGLVAPGAGAPVSLRLGEIPPGTSLSAMAIEAVSRAVVREFNRRRIISLVVGVHPDDIDPDTAEDLREGRAELRMQVWVSTVKQVRTIAAGDRFARRSPEDRTVKVIPEPIDHPKHARVRNRSPVQEGDFIRADLVEKYSYLKSRHPGRRVDVAIAPDAMEPGLVTLDYLVQEAKPWIAYGQISNTGTKNTNEWRERFGFIHNQLTNRDDIFRFDYITAGFEDTNSFSVSYEFPFLVERLRLRPFASWSEFTASDVGQGSNLADFTGTNWQIGLEASFNVLRRKALFVDVFGGFKYDHAEIERSDSPVKGDEDFMRPYVGLRLSRDVEIATTTAEAAFTFSWTNFAGTGREGLQNFTRSNVDDDVTTFTWNVEQSFYLEPLLLNRKAWKGDPDAKKRFRTLGHEIALSFRGQDAGGSRLIPNFQTVAGGLYTVRGYPESLAAGDNLMVFSAEYRVHLPRLFARFDENGQYRGPGKGPMGNDMRWVRTQDFGRTDWDFIVKGFFDWARVTNNSRESFENDHTLSSVGIGLELQFRRNVILRSDFGWALREVTEGDRKVRDGATRAHFVGTILY